MNGQEVRVRLLLVDDEEEFLAAISKALGRRGITVFTARSGKEALRLAEEHEVDAVVLDVKMPGMDGVEVFAQLKTKHSDLPVIMLTGHGTIPQAFQMSKEGVYEYLSKPCDIDKLSATVKEAAAAARAAPAKDVAPDDGGTIRLLIVDDERPFLDTMQKVLGRRGVDVHTAEDGPAALKFLETTSVDVVVLDVKMPGMDGLELLRRIKKAYPVLEIILLTGHPNVDTAVEGMKQGAFEYVVKPPDVDALTELIRKAFHQIVVHRQKEIIKEVLRRNPF